jgi:CRP/FNR family transcriptional regulator, anaerobic regulatory protein
MKMTRDPFLHNHLGLVKVYKLLPDGRRQVTRFLFQGDFLELTFNDC